MLFFVNGHNLSLDESPRDFLTLFAPPQAEYMNDRST